MTRPATEIYAVELQETDADRPKKFLRSVFTLAVGFFDTLTGGPSNTNPGGQIITVVRRSDGKELFRHIEDWGDDEGHLLAGIENDLATMSATDFATRWTE